MGLAKASPLHGQRAIVAGVVMDTAGLPLEAAQISAFRSQLQAMSDRRGQFVLIGLKKGRELIQVRRIGYYAQVFELEVEATDTLRVGITLAKDSIQRLPDVAVVAPPAPTPAERLEREAYERILWSTAPVSALIPRAELAKEYGGRLYPLLVKHGLKSRLNRRGGDSVVCPRSSSPPTVFLDGMGMGADFGLETMSPDQVELVEVYRSSVARPTQYNTPGSGCTVLIWTRR